MASAPIISPGRRRVKVMHVMPSLARAYGGPVEALIGYVVAGQLAGIRSEIVGPQTSPDDARWLQRVAGDTDVTQAGPPAGGLWRSGGAVVSCVAARLRGGGADLVHVHGLLNPISSGAARSAIGRGVPVVIGPFGTMSRYTFAHRRAIAKRLYFRAVDAPNLRRAAGLHFTTMAEREEARWHGIDFGTRAHVVPPPYRGAHLAGTRTANGAPVVLFLGRLHPVKGADILLDAWPAVRASHPGARLIIAGQGTPQYEAELRSRAAALGADAPSVTFPGFVRGAEKAAALAAASVCVLPSLHENFGISVLDSVAAGVPIVVTPGVQLAPWVVKREAGFIAERTASAVAEAVGRALDDAGLRERVARCGPALVDADFAPRTIAPALRAMYEAVLAHGSRPEQAPA
jgi:glycosyltransferase involved in cell wall biosynthesis